MEKNVHVDVKIHTTCDKLNQISVQSSAPSL